jgi:hydroxymethylpyrimidine kinase/phosphomethylpyrimidine kinase/thiamine-phosphate diphosphorylase
MRTPLNTPMARPPILWSIAGLDTAGGAGLSADQRAADALGVHLCPVLACLTAQNSQGVRALFPVSGDALASQLQALAQDLPPRAIKTGLLGSVEGVEAVARWVDHFRAQAPAGTDPHQHLPLVVDPVLKASAGGASFSHAALIQAYRQHLLPRATVLTPNRAEARALLADADSEALTMAALGEALQALGSRAVFITGGDAEPGAIDGASNAHDARHSIDWLQAPHAQGWLTAPRVDTPHHHGTGCTLATGVAAALALGHVEADACVLGKMLTHHALMHSRAAGHGPGPVLARPGFAAGPAHGGAPMPWLGMGNSLPWALGHGHAPATPLFQPFEAPADRLYGIAPTATLLAQARDAGVTCLQLRHKGRSGLTDQLYASLALAKHEGVQLFINDHWEAALDAIEANATPGKVGLHLGQEDLLALSPTEQQRLLSARKRVMLGLSSHSLWELARAAGCGASYIACGPVQATTTKDMPWRPQGTHNLSWWVANSPAPVIAIGGLLTAQDLALHATCQPAALCVVRALAPGPAPLAEVVRSLTRAIASTAPSLTEAMPRTLVALPHPVL